MTSRFIIEVKHTNAGVPGSSAPRPGRVSAAAQADQDSKKAAAAAKKAADAQAKEADRGRREVERSLNLMIRLRDKEAIATERAAKRAADARVREERKAQRDVERAIVQVQGARERARLADIRSAAKATEALQREAKKAADAAEREAKRAAAAQNKALGRGVNRVQGAATSVGYGAFRAAGALAGGAQTAAQGVAQGGITNILETAPRALGDLAKGAGEAAAQLARGIGVGLSKLLPGALSFVPKLIGNAFAVVGELAGALGSAVGEIAGFIGEKLGTALKVAMGVAVGIGIAGIHEALKGDQLTPFFEKFAAASGKTAKQAIDDLKEATQGLISENDLLLASNQAFANQAVENVQQFQNLAQYADAFGDAVGKRPLEALQDLTGALGSLQERGIKRVLGSSVDFDLAFRKAAVSQGKLAEQLSISEKHAIAYSTVVGALASKFGGLQSGAGETADSIDRLKASISDTLNNIGKSLLPALNTVLKAVQPLAAAVGKFFENNNKEIAEGINKAVAGISRGLGNLPAIISNIKLSQVFEIAKKAAESLWITVKAGAEGAFKFILLKFQSMWNTIVHEVTDFVKKYGVIIGGATGGVAGAIAGGTASVAASVAHEQHPLALSGALDREAKRVTFGPKGEDAKVVEENTKAIENMTRALVGAASGKKVEGGTGGSSSTVTVSGSGGGGGPHDFNAGSLDLFDRIRKEQNAAGPVGAPRPTQTAAAVPDIGPILKAFKEFTGVDPEGIQGFVAMLSKLKKEELEAAALNLQEVAVAFSQDKLKDAASKEFDERLAFLEHLKSEGEDFIAKLGDQNAAFIDGKKQIEEERLAAEREVNARFAAAREEIVSNFKSVIDGIASRISSAADSLRSASGFGGEFGGADLEAALPGKFKRAARKRSRRATKALRHELNQQAAGMGDEDLINGGAEQIFQNVAAKQVLNAEGGGLQAQQALVNSITQLNAITAERDAALEKLAQAADEQLQNLMEVTKQNAVLLGEAAVSVAKIADEIKEVKEQQKKTEKALDALQSRGSR